MNKMARDTSGSPGHRIGSDKRGSASVVRERMLVKIIILLVGISVSMVYSLERARAQRSDDRDREQGKKETGIDRQISENARQMVEQGRDIFRYDTFGDEAFWGDTLKLHRAIEGTKFGGVGPGVSPKTALAVGLKVDMDALPKPLVQQIKQGKINLDDPATTLALLKLNAVLGVQGQFNQDGSLKSVGITCALCHSTVDNVICTRHWSSA
ncbi:hypothetical protein BH20ACI3_BH20ACI3_19380 [soil metagenome]